MGWFDSDTLIQNDATNGDPLLQLDIRMAVLKYVVYGEAVLVSVGALATGAIILLCLMYLSSDASRWTKLLAVFVTSVHALQWVFELLGIIDFTVSVIDNARKTSFLWVQVPITILTLVIALSVQAYFGFVAFHLITRKWILVIPCTILGLLSFSFGISVAIAFDHVAHHGFDDNPYVFSGFNTTKMALWLASACALDITLSVVLSLRLLQDLQKTSFKATQSVVTTLMRSTLETFSLTSAASVISLLLELVPRMLPRTSPWTSRLNIMASGIVAYALPRFYVISFLYTLRRAATAKHNFLNRQAPALDSNNSFASFKNSAAMSSNLVEKSSSSTPNSRTRNPLFTSPPSPPPPLSLPPAVSEIVIPWKASHRPQHSRQLTSSDNTTSRDTHKRSKSRAIITNDVSTGISIDVTKCIMYDSDGK